MHTRQSTAAAGEGFGSREHDGLHEHDVADGEEEKRAAREGGRGVDRVGGEGGGADEGAVVCVEVGGGEEVGVGVGGIEVDEWFRGG